MIDYTLTTTATSEPVSLDRVKSHLRIYDNTDDDGYIESLIKAARQKAESVTGRSLVAHTLVLEESENNGEIQLIFPPIGDVSGVVYWNGDDWAEVENYTVGGLANKYVIISAAFERVKITYTTTAYSNEELNKLIMDLIQCWYDNRPDAEMIQELIVKRMAQHKIWVTV